MNGRIPPRRVTLLVMILIGSLVSCTEGVLGPFNETAFVLETIDGIPLPATVTPELGGLAWVVRADTIWLESGSKWRRHSLQSREEGVGGDPLDYTTDGTVIRQDGDLVLAFDCRDGDCIAPDRMVGSPMMLEMERTYLHDGRKLVFRPVE